MWIVTESLRAPSGVAVGVGADEPGEIMCRMIQTYSREVDDPGDLIASEEDMVSPDIAQAELQGQGAALPGKERLNSTLSMVLKKCEGLLEKWLTHGAMQKEMELRLSPCLQSSQLMYN